MANHKSTTSNDILVKVDHNNLMFIDPNSVISNGIIEQREVQPENLVMYVDLEADLIPRTTLISGGKENQVLSIAKGNFNFLQKQGGGDYDTTWTDAYTNRTENYNSDPKAEPSYRNSDDTGQSFSIDNIQIKISGMNFVPQIQIRFIDVRGKTLFESPENSPYKAFFHLPWPIFYLTVKGYYGKAIKYRLHLIKFSSRYNSGNGNMEIDTSFVGSTYAYLNDIPLDGILYAPYLYKIETDKDGQYNEQTKLFDKKISKSTKGYITLTSVYNEYKQKGLLPKNFPVRTLRELLVLSKRLNKILEDEIFSDVISPNILSGVKEFESLISEFHKSVNAWSSKNLSPVIEGGIITGKEYHALNGVGKEKKETITDKTKDDSLARLIDTYATLLKNNAAFGENRDSKLLNNLGYDIHTISFSMVENSQNYFAEFNSKYYVNIQWILDNIYSYWNNFNEQRNKLIDKIQDKMNTVIKRDDGKGLGFEPTIRNIMGVILANADTYIRLLKDVHYNAFQQGDSRKKILKSFSTDSTTADENIYPWPEVKVPTSGTKQNVLVYPGNSQIRTKLQSDDPVLWPEIEFVELFNDIATRKSDPLVQKEGEPDLINYIFETNSDFTNKKDLSTLSNLNQIVPYTNKEFSSLLYEIYERAKYYSSVDSFNNETIRELANIEFENIQTSLSQDQVSLLFLKEMISNKVNLTDFLEESSPFIRYPYYLDQIPTVPYINDSLNQDFSIEKYEPNTGNTINYKNVYPSLQTNLSNYEPESYRKNIYPFSSLGYYGDYLGKTDFTTNDLKTNEFLEVDGRNGFIISPIFPKIWVKDGFTNNIFDNPINIGGVNKHLLNTPYFHKQLYDDFFTDSVVGKYIPSAYLFLSSLPFVDLDDHILYNNKSVLVSSLFREVGASHFIPYHLMLKWGAIYHRYKRYLLDGVDIISGVTTPIDGDVFFDGSYTGRTYNLIMDIFDVQRTASRLNSTDQKNIGINPFYHSVFHQVVNGYSFYDSISVTGLTGYTQSITDGENYVSYKDMVGYTAWTSFIDNSKFVSDDLRFTFLPSNGDNLTDTKEYLPAEQENYRILWNVGVSNVDVPTYSGHTLPDYNQYFKTFNNEYALSTDYKKFIDLVAVFKPEILDTFENAFIDFASETLNEEVPYSPFNVKYHSFQGILKGLVSVKKETGDLLDKDNLLRTLKSKQDTNLKNISNNILSNDNLVKLTLANPKEVNTNILGGFTKTNDDPTKLVHFDYNPFDVSQLTPGNQKYLELYLGEDLDLLYVNFFPINNIELTPENILLFRPLIYIYAGYVTNNGVDTNLAFVDYLKKNIINHTSQGGYTAMGSQNRLDLFFSILLPQFTTLKADDRGQHLTYKMGYNDDPIKLELYNFFKSFNDKWVAGNSLGQRSLMEDFLFLDKANKDVGNLVYLDLERLSGALDQKNAHKLNLFSLIATLLIDTGMDLRPLPAYVNFYGTNFSTSKSKITPSKTVAKNLFGTFLEVDYQEASPRIIIQYVGKSSNHLALSDVDKKAKFKNDSFNVGDPNNNPLIVTPEIFRDTDYSKSNKVIAFEVSFGDQAQSIFKGFNVDQGTIKNTSESYAVLDRLGNSESGASTAQVDIGLYDVYRQASYTCEVTMMGNVMIQPTMFFYLKNVPLFRGSYWIMEVNHSIKPSGIETTFKGSRIPMHSLPDPNDSFLSSYRALFDKLTQDAIARVADTNKKIENPTNSEVILQGTDGKSTIIDKGLNKPISGENLINKSGIDSYGIPYNGYGKNREGKRILLIENNKQKWYKATAVEMGGPDNKIEPNTSMSILSRSGLGKQIYWKDISNTTTTNYFYSTKFILNEAKNGIDGLRNSTTMFLNPSRNSLKNAPVSISSSSSIITNSFDGPINVGPSSDSYSIALSRKLMRELGLVSGNDVYFRIL